jgi:hypothetical protein
MSLELKAIDWVKKGWSEGSLEITTVSTAVRCEQWLIFIFGGRKIPHKK